jgi:ABC-type branched-subunit amino acid transport system ATPase component
VVIVEQSVNVALSLVDHAYVMEKGEMRFDGVAADLLARPDLLRSVFLEGASKNGAPRKRARARQS